MKCREARELILLLIYGELADAEKREVGRHVEECLPCGLALAEERRLQSILSQRAPAEPSEDLVARCRADLSAALRAETTSSGAWWRRAPLTALWARARFSPALAVLLLLVGFLGGFSVDRGLWPAPRRAALQAPIPEALGDEPEAEVASLNSLSADPETGRVLLSYDTLRRTRLEGSAGDPEIRRLLVATVRDSLNAGLRLEALDALRRHTGDQEVRSALLVALQDDSNPGARLKAIEALDERAATDAEVRGAILRALLRDDNPGVRVRAVDALAGARAPETLPVMRRLAHEDPDNYVRLRSSAFLEEMAGRGGR